MSGKDYTEEEKYIIFLDSLPITYREKRQALALTNSVKDFFSSFESLSSLLLKNWGKQTYQTVQRLYSKDAVEKNYQQICKENVDMLTCRSKGYPDFFKNTPAPPLILYYKGDISLLGKRKFSIVGSRKICAWAEKLGEEIAQELGEFFVIVSGIAEGGDSSALRGGLKSGKVISVLPCGHSQVYPSYQKQFLSKIEEKGLSISEYPPFTQAQKYFFPVRNRLIAWLSEGVLILSAGERSGTNTTFNYAEECGIKTFAFPYRPNDLGGVGCNRMIQKGAILTINTVDILSAYGLKSNLHTEKVSSPQETLALKIIGEKGECHIECIAKALNVSVTQTIMVLSILELEGKIVRLGGNRYALC